MTYCDQYTTFKSGLPRIAHMGECEQCRTTAWDQHVVPRIYVGTVPGGYNDQGGNKFHRQFDKGMYEYEKARKEGLQPKATTVEAVREEHEMVKSQERAVKKLKRVGDVEQVKVRPGVET